MVSKVKNGLNTYIVKDWDKPGFPVIGTVVRTDGFWVGTHNDGTTTDPFKTLKAATAAMLAR